MLEKIVVLLIVYGAVLIVDGQTWKRRIRRDHAAYIGAMAIALYLSFGFVTEKDLPNLNDILHFIFFTPAKHIVDYIKVPS